jgi:hypothetical protein
MDPLIELLALSQKHAARYAPYRTPRRARRHLVQIVQIVHLVQECVRCTSSVASSAQDTPVAGGSNPGPKRSGPADGALPVEVHLRSWGKGRAQSGAEVVRSGSYPVSRFVPKKPSRMPLPGGLVRTPPKPETRARWDLVPIVPIVQIYRVPLEPEGGFQVRGGQERCRALLGLDAPLPRPSPAVHCRDPPQFPGVEESTTRRRGRHRQAYPSQALAGLP